MLTMRRVIDSPLVLNHTRPNIKPFTIQHHPALKHNNTVQTCCRNNRTTNGTIHHHLLRSHFVLSQQNHTTTSKGWLLFSLYNINKPAPVSSSHHNKLSSFLLLFLLSANRLQKRTREYRARNCKPKTRHKGRPATEQQPKQSRDAPGFENKAKDHLGQSNIRPTRQRPTVRREPEKLPFISYSHPKIQQRRLQGNEQLLQDKLVGVTATQEPSWMRSEDCGILRYKRAKKQASKENQGRSVHGQVKTPNSR